LPKLILCRGRFGSLRRKCGLVVDAHQWKDTTHYPYFLRMLFQQLIEHLRKLSASHILIIAIFGDGHQRGLSPTDMIGRAFGYEQGGRVGPWRRLHLDGSTGWRRWNNNVWSSWNDGCCADGGSR